MRPAPMSTTPSASRDLGRVADVLIKPEEGNCNNWTKVSTDTFVSGNSHGLATHHRLSVGAGLLDGRPHSSAPESQSLE
jgi:hypothetical protein